MLAAPDVGVRRVGRLQRLRHAHPSLVAPEVIPRRQRHGHEQRELAQALGQVDDLFLAWLQRHSVAWAWTWLEEPLLLRPLWLAPAALALVCTGLALSFTFGKTSPSRRKRS